MAINCYELNLQRILENTSKLQSIRDFCNTNPQQGHHSKNLSSSSPNNPNVCPFDCCQRSLEKSYFSNCELKNTAIKMRIGHSPHSDGGNKHHNLRNNSNTSPSNIPGNFLERRTLYEGRVPGPMRFDELMKSNDIGLNNGSRGASSSDEGDQEILLMERDNLKLTFHKNLNSMRSPNEQYQNQNQRGVWQRQNPNNYQHYQQKNSSGGNSCSGKEIQTFTPFNGGSNGNRSSDMPYNTMRKVSVSCHGQMEVTTTENIPYNSYYVTSECKIPAIESRPQIPSQASNLAVARKDEFIDQQITNHLKGFRYIKPNNPPNPHQHHHHAATITRIPQQQYHPQSHPHHQQQQDDNKYINLLNPNMISSKVDLQQQQPSQQQFVANFQNYHQHKQGKSHQSSSPYFKIPQVKSVKTPQSAAAAQAALEHYEKLRKYWDYQHQLLGQYETSNNSTSTSNITVGAYGNSSPSGSTGTATAGPLIPYGSYGHGKAQISVAYPYNHHHQQQQQEVNVNVETNWQANNGGITNGTPLVRNNSKTQQQQHYTLRGVEQRQNQNPPPVPYYETGENATTWNRNNNVQMEHGQRSNSGVVLNTATGPSVPVYNMSQQQHQRKRSEEFSSDEIIIQRRKLYDDRQPLSNSTPPKQLPQSILKPEFTNANNMGKPNTVLVHGNNGDMMRAKSLLIASYSPKTSTSTLNRNDDYDSEGVQIIEYSEINVPKSPGVVEVEVIDQHSTRHHDGPTDLSVIRKSISSPNTTDPATPERNSTTVESTGKCQQGQKSQLRPKSISPRTKEKHLKMFEQQVESIKRVQDAKKNEQQQRSKSAEGAVSVTLSETTNVAEYDHIVLLDKRVRTYMCKRCLETLKSEQEIRNHLFCKMLQNSIQCHVCRNLFTSEEYPQHLQAHSLNVNIRAAST